MVANAYKSFSDYQLWSPFSVLWLLGAYLELVKLTSSRVLATNRQDYYQRLLTLKQVGGGFPDFDQLTQQIYTLLDDVDPDNPTGVARASRQMTENLQQISWMPKAFREVLQGKNHLPANKLSLKLLRPKQGFLKEGVYRTHFFDDKSLHFLASFFINEKVKYSRPMLQLKRTVKLWKRGLAASPKWGQATAIAILVVASWFVGAAPRLLNPVPELSNAPGQLDTTVMGLVNFLDHPTDFKFVCGNHAGQVVAAVVEDDRLTIEVVYTRGFKTWDTTLTGSLDEQGIFNGTHQTRLPHGLVSGEVSLNFGKDGSAQGVHKDWGGAIAIIRI